MQLYGSYTSPFVRHCRIVLLETGLKYEFMETDLDASAVQSPAQRVPFLRDQDLMLTDSAAILKYLREKTGGRFFDDVSEYDEFLLVNTALDTAINLFLIEKSGVLLEKSAYLQRQNRRVETCLKTLNERPHSSSSPYNDCELRLACFLSWGLFRNRINLENYPNLAAFLEGANRYEPFLSTAP